jgi:hypothetical protein
MTPRLLRRALLSGFLIYCVGAGTASAGQNPFKRGGPKVDYLSFKDPNGQFTLDYPKDWRVIGGVGDVIVTLAEKKNEARILIERFKLKSELKQVTDLFGELETEVLKERQPKATDVTTKMVEQNGMRLVAIDYTYPGLAKPERARQYSLPVGEVVFRVTGSAITAQFAKYDPMFAHAAESFKAVNAGEGPAQR